MLETINISKSFPGVQALQDVNLKFYPFKVNAILGENGAGKSTLLKILTGEYIDYDGEIKLNSKKINFKNIKDAQTAGIAIIHQELNLIPSLNISENIFLGKEMNTAWGTLDKKRMKQIAQTLLSKLGILHSPDTLIQHLKVGEQQLIEIAKVLFTNAQIIMMDEPSSALSNREIENLHRIIHDLKNEGKTIVYISHKMDELFKISEYFTVLRDGKSVYSGEMHQTTERELIQKMAGRDLQIQKKDSTKSIGKAILKLNDLSLQHPTRSNNLLLNKISFHLNKGEILGIFGLMGAGRTELLQTLFGLNPTATIKSIHIAEKEVFIDSPKAAIRNGLGFITEDRKSEGLVLGMNIVSNINLTSNEQDILIDQNKEIKIAKEYINSLSIKTPNDQQSCAYLSGGNQQKVILAKWLATHPNILMLDEPTRGIDINAKNEIYTLIKKLSSEGMSILLVSSEIPEILALADRILVLSEGKMTGEFSIEEANEEKLLKAAIVV